MGECAFAKWRGVYWEGSVNNAWSERSTDVDGFEVKTRSRHHYELPVELKDTNIDKKWALVTGVNGRYRIHGWVVPRPHLLDKYKDVKVPGRDPSWFIPQSLLEPF